MKEIKIMGTIGQSTVRFTGKSLVAIKNRDSRLKIQSWPTSTL